MARIRHPWSEIQCFYDDGQSAKECRARFAFSVQSWYKAVRFGRMVLREGDVRLMRSRGPGNYQYDWQAVQRYYDEGHTYRECSAHFGFGPDSWTDARRRGALRARARALNRYGNFSTVHGTDRPLRGGCFRKASCRIGAMSAD